MFDQRNANYVAERLETPLKLKVWITYLLGYRIPHIFLPWTATVKSENLVCDFVHPEVGVIGET
jgi:hypothetical protein